MQSVCEGLHFRCSDRVRRSPKESGISESRERGRLTILRTESEGIRTSPNESEISETAWEWSHIHFSDVLPHETAVAWARTYFKKHPVAKGAGVADMERQFRAILEQCAQHINAEYDVGGLCKAFPTRLRELIAAEGERLSN